MRCYTLGGNQPDGPLADAIEWFKDNGIPLLGVNQNPTQHKWTTSPKAYAQLYIDDAALGCPLILPTSGRPYVDWNAIKDWFLLHAATERKNQGESPERSVAENPSSEKVNPATKI